MSHLIIEGDCIEQMAQLPDASIDLVLTDPPYGTTNAKWDAVIPFEVMWSQLQRVTKPSTAVVLFSAQPFTSALVMSRPQTFKHEWIWRKNSPTGHLNVKRKPLLNHESIVVFGGTTSITYNPQGLRPFQKMKRRGVAGQSENYGKYGMDNWQEVTGYPKSVIDFDVERPNGFHPQQKPVELLRYLVRTYSNQGDTVLDFTCGSGSTGVACMLENRSFIGIEREANYVEIARQRIEQAKTSAGPTPRS